ncbi:PaaI family thioesterase [Pantoea sp. 18069]|uniref:PaaI family thioesterase n=1 Tax=Pantoea sp. 18069 TaxID=2681415 RepID=UPI00135A70CB|nr:PaaI family thioesterase [Pantoea sp. 18069]
MLDSKNIATPLHSPQTRRVLQALQACRTPGWMFAGHFLDMVFTQNDQAATVVTLEVGPHCRAADGRISLATLSILADVAMAAAVRSEFGPSARVATLTIRLTFASLPAQGVLRAVAKLEQIPRVGAMQSAMTSVEIYAEDGSLCCSSAASFAVLENRQGTADHPMPRTSTLSAASLLPTHELHEAEQAVWERALQAEQDAGQGSFIERFWGILPVAGSAPGQASCRVESGMHIGNRSGHVQGGILLGVAAATCTAALPEGWSLLDLSAQYLDAGAGPYIDASAATLRSGRNLAVVECRVVDSASKPIFSAQATCLRGR